MLKGKTIANRNLYFFRSYQDQYTAVISGDWKLIKYRSGKFELFNLKDDIGETVNLIDTKKVVAVKLKNDVAAWEKEATTYVK